MLEEKQKKLYYIDKSTKNRYLFRLVESKYTKNTSLTIEDILYNLPNFIEGQILTNTDGYNPSGWWTNIKINKYDLIFQ